MRLLTLSFANTLAQLAGGESLASTSLEQRVLAALPFGLRNAAATVDHLLPQQIFPCPADSEFVGMMDYTMESFYDLLEGDSDSSSDSSSASHHPSHKCFMAELAEVHVEVENAAEHTPPPNPQGEVAEGAGGEPPPWLELLRERQRRIGPPVSVVHAPQTSAHPTTRWPHP